MSYFTFTWLNLYLNPLPVISTFYSSFEILEQKDAICTIFGSVLSFCKNDYSYCPSLSMGLQGPEKLKNFNNNKFSLHLPSTFVASMMYKATGLVFSCTSTRTSDPSVKVNSTLSVTASTFLHRLVLLSVCFIYKMSRWYSTDWDGKVDPAREFKCTMEYIAEWSI